MSTMEHEIINDGTTIGADGVCTLEEIVQLRRDLAFANQQKDHYERLFIELLNLADPLAEWVSTLVAVRIPPVDDSDA